MAEFRISFMSLHSFGHVDFWRRIECCMYIFHFFLTLFFSIYSLFVFLLDWRFFFCCILVFIHICFPTNLYIRFSIMFNRNTLNFLNVFFFTLNYFVYVVVVCVFDCLQKKKYRLHKKQKKNHIHSLHMRKVIAKNAPDIKGHADCNLKKNKNKCWIKNRFPLVNLNHNFWITLQIT